MTIVTVPLQNGWTAMVYASQEGHEHVVEALLKEGATVDIQEKVLPVITWQYVGPPPLCPHAYVVSEVANCLVWTSKCQPTLL